MFRCFFSLSFARRALATSTRTATANSATRLNPESAVCV
jgi:hypothetical protein